MKDNKNKKEKKQNVLFRILSYTKRHIAFLCIAILCAVISVAAILYAPVIIGRAIDYIIGAGEVDFSAISPLLWQLLIVIAIAAIFQWLMNYCTNLITHKTVKDLRDELFSKLNLIPLKYLDKTPHGDLISRMINDIDMISDGLIQGFTKLFSGVITIGGTIFFMFKIHPPIAIVIILVTPLSLFVSAFIAKKVYRHFKEQATVKGELSGYIEEMISEQGVVKIFGYESKSQEKFDEINSRLYESGVKSQFFSSLPNPCTRFVNAVVYASVGIAGAISVIGGGLSVGMLSTFLSYANQYTKPFNEISGVITELQAAFASARRVFAVIDTQSEPQDLPDAIAISSTDCTGQVEAREVAFSYQPDTPLISGLNVTAHSGERIAIVGPTGCGKTTIINLLMRFYDIDAGEIRVDGVDIRKLARNSLRSCYGMVLQDTWLFSGTIAQNIAYSKENATRDEIIQAAKMAHAHSFIKRLENGYDTIITGDGDNISAGQKQLLCIARVMLSLPPMLILDEATSSIDTRTELKIQKAFNLMMEGRTSFIVAHRLSTIKEADCILVMESGKIIEQGRHDELLQRGGFYKKLYESQFSKS